MRVLTPEEAATILQVPRRTVTELCARSELVGARKVGRSWRIPEWALEAFFGPRPVAGADDGFNMGATAIATRTSSTSPALLELDGDGSDPRADRQPRRPTARAVKARKAPRSAFVRALDGFVAASRGIDMRPNRRGAKA